ncbi:hypothetical protein CFP56_041165 [Quercus suber]|uniref:Uncharacterized protein n=1 Tax=Quercus suber TaxID=58331 RepID=A0AAW0IWE0_QUESU
MSDSKRRTSLDSGSERVGESRKRREWPWRSSSPLFSGFLYGWVVGSGGGDWCGRGDRCGHVCVSEMELSRNWLSISVSKPQAEPVSHSHTFTFHITIST